MNSRNLLLIKSGTVAYLDKWLLDVNILFGNGSQTETFDWD